jgi:hypothetical protein
MGREATCIGASLIIGWVLLGATVDIFCIGSVVYGIILHSLYGNANSSYSKSKGPPNANYFPILTYSFSYFMSS